MTRLTELLLNRCEQINHPGSQKVYRSIGPANLIEKGVTYDEIIPVPNFTPYRKYVLKS